MRSRSKRSACNDRRCSQNAKPSRRCRVPVVQRIAPQLAISGEVVRRHARDLRDFAVVAQQELLACSPRGDRIGRDVDRQVAKDAHVARSGVDAQRAPLRVKAPLLARQRIDGGRKALLGPGQRVRITIAQRRRPSPPGLRPAVPSPAPRTARSRAASAPLARKSSKSPSVPGSCASAIEKRRIAGAIGTRPVGRAAVIHRHQRQHLPHARSPPPTASR